MIPCSSRPAVFSWYKKYTAFFQRFALKGGAAITSKLIEVIRGKKTLALSAHRIALHLTGCTRCLFLQFILHALNCYRKQIDISHFAMNYFSYPLNDSAVVCSFGTLKHGGAVDIRAR
ncbi:Uncharacterised protein [Enterobacter hormaechei]|nr:Uncharacterised protein [Enterobacter hormaechei]SAB59710.1 Uncharacterised protein [Enterobacter hormaechei]SAC12560.1 Uncharacterised protein [Enterobacter hormaechei]SAF43609.1 Uncharacterised protein [Enterobacter hormaechei]VAM04674.1 Uncharacterised protein [Enterobacter hormaechei]